jgi:BNR repeat-like domain
MDVRRVRILLVVSASLAMSLGWGPLPLAAEDPPDEAIEEVAGAPWSQPAKISGDVGGWFPSVAADNAGNVHVVWQSGFTSQSKHDISALYYVRGTVDGWTAPNDIALISPEGHALRSSLAVDAAGRVHLIHKGLGQLAPESLGQEDLWYTTAGPGRGDSASDWLAPRRLTFSDQGYFSDLAIDSHGVVHALWSESNGGSWGINYAHSSDSGANWTTPLALDGSNPVWWYRAHLKIDGQDHLHAVWEVTDAAHLGTTRGTMYALSADGGLSWTQTQFPANLVFNPFFDTPGPGPQQPTVGIDGSGTILLVYREPLGDRIVYRQSPDGSHWSEAVPLPGVRMGVARPYDVYDMVTDAAGHVHLALVAYSGNADSPDLLHVEWDGQRWARVSVVSHAPPFPEYPKLAIAEGNRLSLVWFGGDRLSVDRKPTGIWYSTLQTDAPHVVSHAAAASPTPITRAPAPITPGVMNTPKQAPEPVWGTSTSTAPEAWLAQWQTQPIFPLLVGVTPVLILLGMVFLVRIAR